MTLKALLLLSIYASFFNVLNADSKTLPTFIIQQYHDKTNSETIKTINNANFIKSRSFINQIDHKGTYWFRVKISNETANTYELILSNTSSYFDTFIFYELDGKNSVIKTANCSKEIQYKERNYKSIVPAISFKMNAKENKTILIKAKAQMYFFSQLSLQTREDFLETRMINNDLHIFYFGISLTLFIYFIIIFYVSRELIYLYYSLFLLFLSNTLFVKSGMYVYINSLWIDYGLALASITFIFLLLISREMIGVNIDKKFFTKIVVIVSFFIILTSIFMLYNKYIGAMLSNVLMLISFIIPIMLVYYSTKENRIYFITQLLFISSLASMPLIGLELIELNFFTDNIILFSSYIDIILFSVILGNKMMRLKEKELEANIKLLTLQEEQTTKLEKQVAEQTKHLNILFKELQHRVKNNFQFILTFLWAQKHSSVEKETKVALDQLKDRINAIIHLHDTLNEYEHNNPNIQKHFKKLTDNYRQTRPEATIECNINNLSTNYNLSVNLGLIANELLTNSFKYAFHNIDNPSIQISLKRIKDRVYFIYQDNGLGFDTELIGKNSGYGYEFIEEFTQKFKNFERKISAIDGLRFELSFDIDEEFNSD